MILSKIYYNWINKLILLLLLRIEYHTSIVLPDIYGTMLVCYYYNRLGTMLIQYMNPNASPIWHYYLGKNKNI